MVMKNNIRLIDALSASRQIIETIEGEECKILCVPVEYVEDDGSTRKYISFSICKTSEAPEATIKLRGCEGMDLEEFIRNNPYHHISTFPIEYAGDEDASFGIDDDNPIKILLKDEDIELNKFFTNYINFINYSVDNNLTVKEDDIYQNLYLFINKIKEERGEKISFVQYIKRFFSK